MNTLQSSVHEKPSKEKHEAFSPQQTLDRIRPLPRHNRRAELDTWYARLNRFHHMIDAIIQRIRHDVWGQNFDHFFPSDVRNVIKQTIESLKRDFPLDDATEKMVTGALHNYAFQKFHAHQEAKRHRTHPERSFIERHGIQTGDNEDITARFSHPVEIDVVGAHMVWYIHIDDRHLLREQDFSGAYFSEYRDIIVLSHNAHSRAIILTHELQHAENTFLFPEIEHYAPVNSMRHFHMATTPREQQDHLCATALHIAFQYGKDEVIAYLREWCSAHETIAYLTDEKGEYNYGSGLIGANYKAFRRRYVPVITEAARTAEVLMRQWVSPYILALTPLQKWNRLTHIARLEPIETSLEPSDDKTLIGSIHFLGGIEFRGIFDENHTLISGEKIYPLWQEEGIFDPESQKLMTGTQIKSTTRNREQMHIATYTEEWEDGEKTEKMGVFHGKQFIRGTMTLSQDDRIEEIIVGDFVDNSLHTFRALLGSQQSFEYTHSKDNITQSTGEFQWNINSMQWTGTREYHIPEVIVRESGIFHTRDTDIYLHSGHIHIIPSPRITSLHNIARKILWLISRNSLQIPVKHGEIQIHSTAFQQYQVLRSDPRYAHVETLLAPYMPTKHMKESV